MQSGPTLAFNRCPKFQIIGKKECAIQPKSTFLTQADACFQRKSNYPFCCLLMLVLFTGGRRGEARGHAPPPPWRSWPPPFCIVPPPFTIRVQKFNTSWPPFADSLWKQWSCSEYLHLDMPVYRALDMPNTGSKTMVPRW